MASGIPNMMTSWLRRKSKKLQKHQDKLSDSPTAPDQGCSVHVRTPSAGSYVTVQESYEGGRGRLPLPPPAVPAPQEKPYGSHHQPAPALAFGAAAAAAVAAAPAVAAEHRESPAATIYEEIPALLRDSPAQIDAGNLDIGSLDFAKAREIGKGYVLVPKREVTDRRERGDSGIRTGVGYEGSADSLCRCPTASHASYSRHRPDRLYRSNDALADHRQVVSVCTEFGPNRVVSSGPDLLNHGNRSETEEGTDSGSGSGCSCYRTQDILLRCAEVTERRKSITSTDTENYYETVACAQPTQTTSVSAQPSASSSTISTTQKQTTSSPYSSHVVYSTVSVKTQHQKSAGKSPYSAMLVQPKTKAATASQSSYVKSVSSRQPVSVQVSSGGATVAGTGGARTKVDDDYQSELLRVKQNMSLKENVNRMVRARDHPSVNGVMSATDTSDAYQPAGDGSVGGLQPEACNDMGLLTTDSDESYPESGDNRSKSKIPAGSKRIGVLIEKRGRMEPKAVTVPRSGKREKARRKLDAVKSSFEHRRIKSATYPRLEKSPYTDNTGDPFYENAAVKQVASMRSNKVLTDLIKRNHDHNILKF